MRTMRLALRVGLSLLLLYLGIWVRPAVGFAQMEEAPAEEEEQALTKQELEKIQRRLDQIAANHQTLRKALDDINAELAIVKVRVTN